MDCYDEEEANWLGKAEIREIDVLARSGLVQLTLSCVQTFDLLLLPNGGFTASNCGQTRKCSLSRRRRSLCGKDPGKILAVVEEQHKPEHRHDQGARDAFVIEQQMTEQNIYDYRPKNRQASGT